MRSICWLHKWNKQYKVDNAKDIDVVMPIYNVIEYSDNYTKTSGSLWQFCWDEPALNTADNISDFPTGNNNNVSIEFKQN